MMKSFGSALNPLFMMALGVLSMVEVAVAWGEKGLSLFSKLIGII